jgi:hypothetical protein
LVIGERVLNFTIAPSPDSHAMRQESESGEPPRPASFPLFKFFVFLSRPFAWFAVQFLPHAGGMRFLT